MKYWTINIWDLMPELIPTHASPETYDQHLKSLEKDDYDAVILYCQCEYEFYNIPKYQQILEITKRKKINVYVLVGLEHQYKNLPENVHIICWPSHFFRQTAEQLAYDDLLLNRKIKTFDEIFINDLDNLTYKYHFLYMNGKSHLWRSRLIEYVAKYDLLKYSAYSWHSTSAGQFKYYDGSKKILDKQYTSFKDHGWLPKEYYESFFQLVPESCMDAHFITEKTITPLLIGKPFLIAGATGINKKLKSFGFELYEELFDYTFDDIDDIDQKYIKICKNIKKIVNMPLEQCKEMHSKIQDKVIHNRKRAIEFAYDLDNVPEIVKYTIQHFDETGIKLDYSLILTEQRLRVLKNNYYKMRNK